jgi:hypothetical protein
VALRLVEARRATKRRFGPEADATWTAFRGDFGTSARIDLLLRDADAQWSGAFGARSVYDLAAVAQNEAFGGAWMPLDDVDAEELWRRIVAAPTPKSAADASVSLGWPVGAILLLECGGEVRSKARELEGDDVETEVGKIVT